MADTVRFPNKGYDVTICRRQDILDCIDKNIVDKDLVLSVIEHCEFQAANFLREGKWTGIPFIGNIRTPKSITMLQSDEQQALIKEAKEKLDRERYFIFKKALTKENMERISQERYYKYITSIAVKKNRKLFNKLCKTKGEAYARLRFYTSYEVVAVNNEYLRLEDYEQ